MSENNTTVATKETQESSFPLPSANTLLHAARIGVAEDKPILMDYWCGSCEKTVIIGVREIEGELEKLLVKSEEEYTSPIARIFQVEEEFIIITENSIYLTSAKISKKKISS